MREACGLGPAGWGRPESPLQGPGGLCSPRRHLLLSQPHPLQPLWNTAPNCRHSFLKAPSAWLGDVFGAAHESFQHHQGDVRCAKSQTARLAKQVHLALETNHLLKGPDGFREEWPLPFPRPGITAQRAPQPSCPGKGLAGGQATCWSGAGGLYPGHHLQEDRKAQLDTLGTHTFQEADRASLGRV